jgi:beta-galactosidase GanA
LGLNTLSIYIFWNLHEIQRGQFDFTTGQRDLVGFLELSKKHGFKVLLRPGPYVCAEWDFGGLPARLLGIKDLVIRSYNSAYHKEVWLYFSALSEVIRPYLQINGGNIIMLQIENEFGSLSREWRHTGKLIDMWRRLNISANFYNEDGYDFWQKVYWPGLSIGLSGGH